MRTLVIGDIHGAYKALLQALRRASFDARKDRLIVLGDVVDGWSQSREVMDFLIEAFDSNPENVYLRGNHDAWCEDWMRSMGATQNPAWVRQGGQATLESFDHDPAHPTLREYFRLVRNYFEEDGMLFVHAGADPRFPADKHHAMDLLWDRSLWTRTWLTVSDEQWVYRTIFVGHTAHTEDGLWRGRVCNLDTGCGWYGHLTVMDLETQETFTSDPVQNLYPDEKGRRG